MTKGTSNLTIQTFFAAAVVLYGCRRETEKPRETEKKGEKEMELIVTALIASVAAVVVALIAAK